MTNLACPHCDTSVDEHEAGRCLDAWVSQHIRGHPVWTNSREMADSYGFYHLPYYSTDIAAAWDVVGRMGSMWMDATVPGIGIDVEFETGRKGTASTAPLAICRAALKAVGE